MKMQRTVTFLTILLLLLFPLPLLRAFSIQSVSGIVPISSKGSFGSVTPLGSDIQTGAQSHVMPSIPLFLLILGLSIPLLSAVVLRKTKGQASLEYMIVVGVSLAVLLPTIYLFMNYSTTSQASIDISRLNTIGNRIISNAEKIYYLGPPSKITIEETFPSNIEEMYLIWRPGAPTPTSELVIRIRTANGATEKVFLSDLQLVKPGTPVTANSINNFTVTGSKISSGSKKIQISANDTWVDVNILA